MTTTFKQKLALAGFSLFLTFIILETVLRFGGLLFLTTQEWNNRVNPAGDEVRILCIGESMTALGGRSSYPSQLEDILNARDPSRRYRVINKGVPSTTSKDILDTIDSILTKYQPHIVLSMIGVNDIHVDPRTGRFSEFFFRSLNTLRTFRFFKLLGQHIKARLSRPSAAELSGEITNWNRETALKFDIENPDEAESLLVDVTDHIRLLETQSQQATDKQEKADLEATLFKLKLRKEAYITATGRYYRSLKEFTRAITFLKDGLASTPGSYAIFIELGRCYSDQQDYETAMTYYRKALDVNRMSTLGWLELARCYSKLGRLDNVYEIYHKMLTNDVTDLNAVSNIGKWYADHDYHHEAEIALLKALSLNPGNYELNEELGELYFTMGEEEKSKKYFEAARTLKELSEKYLPSTIYHYNEIADAVFTHKARLICLQYPRRSIDTLKQIFWSDYPIIFIDNKDNFNEALAREGYNEYFSDSFAVFFGHCTPKGNRLIAETAADVILKNLADILPPKP